MSEEFCDTLFLAAPLHDIGKIGIPDAILLKPGKLTDDEWITMRSHCEIGGSILRDRNKFTSIASKYGSALATVTDDVQNPVINMAATIARSHHEKWDGSGYPNSLIGDQIPLVGRIVAIADVFDALRSRRPYKEPFEFDRAISIITSESGSHFDPKVVDAFQDSLHEILRIDEEFQDEFSCVTV